MPTATQRDSMPSRLATGVTLVIGLLAALLTALVTSQDVAMAELQGTIAGHAFSLEGSETGNQLKADNRVDLPPGGAGSDPIAVVSGPLTVDAKSANTDCSGTRAR